MLRRMGSSMDAGGTAARVRVVSPAVPPGTLTTQPLRFSGLAPLRQRRRAPTANCGVELLDQARPTAPFSVGACRKSGDKTRA